MTTAGKKKFILPLAGGMAAIALLVTLFLVAGPVMETPVSLKDIRVDSEAVVKLGLMEQVSKKNGITEWELKAATATLLKSQDKAVLEEVRVIFYTEKRKTVTLTANQGTLNTRTHDMEFLGDVLVRHESYSLRTDKLHYKKKPHIILSDVRVRLEDGASVVEADTMRTELNENKITLQGNVEGTFSEKSIHP